MRDYPPADIVKALFPFLERPLWEEWDLIKAKKSTLSSNQRARITDLCSKIEKQDEEREKKQNMIK
jgi:hypothetical protein